MAPEFAIEGFVMWSLSSMHDKCNECMFQAYMHQSNTLNQTVQCINARMHAIIFTRVTSCCIIQILEVLLSRSSLEVALYSRPSLEVVKYSRSSLEVFLYADPFQRLFNKADPVQRFFLYSRPSLEVILYSRPSLLVVLYSRRSLKIL